MFSIVNVYLDHLKFYLVCNNGQRYICCSECNVVSNECNKPSPTFTVVKLCNFGVFALGVSLVS